MTPDVYAANVVEAPQPLTIREQRFCRELAIDDSNVSRAARRAGYSMRSAGQIGHALLKKHEIQSYRRLIEIDYRKKAEITATRVLTEMNWLATSDIREITIAADGSIDWDETSPEVAKAIQVLDVKRTDTKAGTRFETKIKLYDKRASLVTFFQHLGLVSAELPPLEILLNRLPPTVSAIFRRLLSGPPPEERERLRAEQQASSGIPVPAIGGIAAS